MKVGIFFFILTRVWFIVGFQLRVVFRRNFLGFEDGERIVFCWKFWVLPFWRDWGDIVRRLFGHIGFSLWVWWGGFRILFWIRWKTSWGTSFPWWEWTGGSWLLFGVTAILVPRYRLLDTLERFRQMICRFWHRRVDNSGRFFWFGVFNHLNS